MYDKDGTYRIRFSQLDGVLTALGFVRRDTPEFIAYREAEHDAIILFRKLEDNEMVGDPYMVGVRNTVVGKGIVTNARFRSLVLDSINKDGISSRNPLGSKPRKSLSGPRQVRSRKSYRAALIQNA